MIYLDNHTTTRPCSPACDRMQFYLREMWGVPTQLHAAGKEVTENLEHHYQTIYDLFHASSEDSFIFTSSGTEAINHVILSSYFEIARKTGKNQFVTCALEDAPILMSLQRLSELGCQVKTVPVLKGGEIDLAALKDALNPKTALVSLSWAHGLTGVIQDIPEAAKICEAASVPLHVDATYAAGKVYISLQDVKIAYLSFAGDRLHAPKSTGGLFIHKDSVLAPLFVGGKEQAGLRASPFDMPSFAALSAACGQALLTMDQMTTEVVRLRDKLQDGLQSCGAVTLFQDSFRLPNVLVVAFPGVWHEALLYALNRKGLMATFGGGSCQFLAKSLQLCSYEASLANSALSFALSRNTTEDEIEQAIRCIASEVQKLRKISGIFS